MKQEHVLSCQVARYLRMRGYVTLDCDVMIAHQYIPKNNKKAHLQFIESRKKIGYTLGQPDLVAINKYGKTTYIELKDGNNNDQTDNQKYFEQEIKCRGGNYVLIRDFDDCINFVKGDNVQTTGTGGSPLTPTSPSLKAKENE